MQNRSREARWPLRQLLLSIATNDPDDGRLARLAARVEPQALVEACHHHRVVSLAHERLRRIDGVAADVVGPLGRMRMAFQMHCLGLEQAQASVGAALPVPWLSLKGDVLARWYADPASREFGDLDVLVRPNDFRAALEALEVAGFAPIGGNWNGFRAYEVAEVPLAYLAGSVDLHWHVVAMGESRRHMRLSTEELFERAVTVRSGGSDVATLDPVDTLLHLCVNAGLDGARRLRALIDVDTVVRSGRVDLDEFARRARAARVGRLAAAVVQRAADLVGSPLPAGLVRELSPGWGWRAINRIVDRTSGGEARPTAGIASGLLLSSGRDTLPATVAAFVRHGSRAVLAATGRPGLTDPGGALDWQRQPEDGRVDVARAAYLDWVSVAGR